MKVALCVIGRLENQYALEFVEYYKSIGFDKIFIYDNNHNGEERFEEVIKKYVDEGFVEVVCIRNIENAQLVAYNHCYETYGKDYDWIAFFDFDEFLTLVKDKDIHEFLSRFNDYQAVKINWMIFTDNGLVKNDGRPVLERFTTPMIFDKTIVYIFPENFHTKCILRGNIDGLLWANTPHFPTTPLKCANPLGLQTDTSPFQPYDFSVAYLKHFRTKTIDEWINNKYKRGVADRTYELFEKTYSIDSFFKYNEKTQEKVDFINEHKNK
jgi:hypothetical protein